MFAPYENTSRSVRSIMWLVIVALLPTVVTAFFVFGPLVIYSLATCSISALLFEAIILKMRKKPLSHFVFDGSALITAWLISLSLPFTAPWWLLVIATFIAIVITKHLYGGLGHNIFNPAMMAYAVCLIAYPSLMSQWPTTSLALLSWHGAWLVFTQQSWHLDGITQSTVLDTVRTGILSKSLSIEQIRHLMPKHFGFYGSPGYELVSLSCLIGGVVMWWKKVISWQMTIPFFLIVTLLSFIGHSIDPAHFTQPGVELLSGGMIFSGLFIITDPVSGASTPKGKIIFSLGVGCLTFIIRHFGGYPDGIAFAVILMNMLVPIIDRFSQSRVFGR